MSTTRKFTFEFRVAHKKGRMAHRHVPLSVEIVDKDEFLNLEQFVIDEFKANYDYKDGFAKHLFIRDDQFYFRTKLPSSSYGRWDTHIIDTPIHYDYRFSPMKNLFEWLTCCISENSPDDVLNPLQRLDLKHYRHKHEHIRALEFLNEVHDYKQICKCGDYIYFKIEPPFFMGKGTLDYNLRITPNLRSSIGLLNYTSTGLPDFEYLICPFNKIINNERVAFIPPNETQIQRSYDLLCSISHSAHCAIDDAKKRFSNFNDEEIKTIVEGIEAAEALIYGRPSDDRWSLFRRLHPASTLVSPPVKYDVGDEYDDIFDF